MFDIPTALEMVQLLRSIAWVAEKRGDSKEDILLTIENAAKNIEKNIAQLELQMEREMM